MSEDMEEGGGGCREEIIGRCELETLDLYRSNSNNTYLTAYNKAQVCKYRLLT